MLKQILRSGQNAPSIPELAIGPAPRNPDPLNFLGADRDLLIDKEKSSS